MTVIRPTGPAQFLSVIPHLLGYTPTASLVLVAFQGSRSVGAMRVDLPPFPEHHDQAAHVLVGLVCRIPDADGFAAIIYDTHRDPSHDVLITELRRRADACGVRVVDALSVTDDGYGRIGEDLLPPEDLTPVEIDGITPADGDQHAGSTLPEPEPALMAAATLVDLVPALTDRDIFVGMVEKIATGTPVDAELFAFACTVLELPALRDPLLVGVIGGTGATAAAWDAQQAWENGADYPAEYAQPLWGEGPRPDPARLGHLDALLRRVAATEGRTLPGSLATLAWVSWALGHSTIASDFADAAHACDQDHGLAGIVTAMVNAGHLPHWAFTRP